MALQADQPFGKVAYGLLFVLMTFTSITLIKLYRSNLLLSIVRPVAETTPNTLEEIVDAVEQGKESRINIPSA